MGEIGELIDISQVDKAEILRALYNYNFSQDFGFPKCVTEKMSLSEAQSLLNESQSFDYIHGKIMKIDIEGDYLNTTLYDKDNGHGAARAALSNENLI